ncbi:MAG: SDR family NAD(P)-dependent oxidoreductase [Sulfurimonas sp.]|nr:SDR family NAD(P)-dependent oxidoreductase [Sulfurimonas sp.]
MSQIVWLIGASNGIGLELAKIYLEKKYRVIVSARDTAHSVALSVLKAEYETTLHLIDMDVSQTRSVLTQTQQVWNTYGGLDMCIYNAGVYESMKIEQWNLEHFEAMNQVNYMGAVRVLTQLTPLFEKQKKGHIAFNISISSYFGLPYGGGYSAPKAALLNLCESIQPELAAKKIKLQVINHGFVKTRLTAKNAFEMPQLLEPEEAARKIYEGVTHSKAFEIKFPWALTRFLHFLRIVPYSLAFSLTKKAL